MITNHGGNEGANTHCILTWVPIEIDILKKATDLKTIQSSVSRTDRLVLNSSYSVHMVLCWSKSTSRSLAIEKNGSSRSKCLQSNL